MNKSRNAVKKSGQGQPSGNPSGRDCPVIVNGRLSSRSLAHRLFPCFNGISKLIIAPVNAKQEVVEGRGGGLSGRRGVGLGGPPEWREGGGLRVAGRGTVQYRHHHHNGSFRRKIKGRRKGRGMRGEGHSSSAGDVCLLLTHTRTPHF